MASEWPDPCECCGLGERTFLLAFCLPCYLAAQTVSEAELGNFWFTLVGMLILELAIIQSLFWMLLPTLILLPLRIAAHFGMVAWFMWNRKRIADKYNIRNAVCPALLFVSISLLHVPFLHLVFMNLIQEKKVITCGVSPLVGEPTKVGKAPPSTSSGTSVWYQEKKSGTSDLLLQLVRHDGELAALHKVMRVLDPHNLGVGRDVKECEKYTNLAMVHAWKVSKPMKRVIFDLKSKQAAMEIESIRAAGLPTPQTHTITDHLGFVLDSNVNEKMLLTGTGCENVLTMLHNGVDPRFCGGLFGNGAYFAEAASKIDQYVEADPGSGQGSEQVRKLHEMLYEGTGVAHPGKVFYCFVVRVILGATIHTRDGETNINPPKEKIWARTGGAEKRQLTTVPKTNPPVHYHFLVAETGGKIKRHREFVIFDGDRAIIEYLLAFRRQ